MKDASIDMTSKEEAACILQAVWRSYRTRKYILQTRKEYETIAKEIEGDILLTSKQIVTWPSKFLCLPKFVSVSVEKRKICNNESVSNSFESTSHNEPQDELVGIPSSPKWVDDFRDHPGEAEKKNDKIVSNSPDGASQNFRQDGLVDITSSQSTEKFDDASRDNLEEKNNGSKNASKSPDGFLLNVRQDGLGNIETSQSTEQEKNQDNSTNVNNSPGRTLQNVRQDNLGNVANCQQIKQCSDENPNEACKPSASVKSQSSDSTEFSVANPENKALCDTSQCSSLQANHTRDNEKHAYRDSPSSIGGSKEHAEGNPENRKSLNNEEDERPGRYPVLLSDSWNTEKSFCSSYHGTEEEMLKKEQKDLMMELLWIQQAIESRKEYLRMKDEN